MFARGLLVCNSMLERGLARGRLISACSAAATGESFAPELSTKTAHQAEKHLFKGKDDSITSRSSHSYKILRNTKTPQYLFQGWSTIMGTTATATL